MRPASDLVALLRPHVGESYVLGSQAPKDAKDYRGPWDCAELASWGVYQTTGRLLGCTDTGKPPARADAYSGAWARDAETIPGIGIHPAIAAATVGAILVRAPGAPGLSGHVAVSTGNGATIEAYDTKHGVIESRSTGRRWTHGVLVPGLAYDLKPALSLSTPKVLRLGATGPEVVKLQTALTAKGYPCAIDGAFGMQTAGAVTAFQASAHLVPDGEVGPLTAGALGL